VLDRLKASDRLAELFADLGVLGGGLQCPPGDPGGLGGEQGGGEIGKPLPRNRQSGHGNRIQRDPGQRTREIGGVTRFDADPVSAGINQHDVLADR